MPEMPIGAALRWLAEREPHALAIREIDPATGGDRALTRADLHRAALRLAATWRSESLAVRRDDIVAISPRTGTEVLVAACAAWALGAVPLPLPPDQPAAERRAVLTAADPALLVASVDVAGLLDAVGGEPLPPALPDVAASSWKAATSGGSTGPPKVILSTRPGLVDPLRPAVAFAPATGAQLVPAALHHSASFTYAARALMAGQPLVLLRSPGPADVLIALATHHASWALLPPSMMQAIWHLGPRAREGLDLSALDRIVHIGAPCPAWLKRAWIDWLGPARVVEVYASTESHVVTVIDGREWLDHPGSVGRARSGAFRILDDAGRDLPPGTVGQVWVMPESGPGSTYRYLGGISEGGIGDAVGSADGSDERVHAPSREGWETLGDLGWLEEGGWLHLVDRAGDVVITAAGPVHPAAVEEVLSEHPAIRSVVVVGVAGVAGVGGAEPGARTDGDSAQRLHAVVDVGNPTELPLSPAELLAWAAARLPPAAVPETVEIVDIPLRDAAGKVRRREVVERPG